MTERGHNLRVLIIGVDGKIGNALAFHLRKSGAMVYGTSRRTKQAYDGATIELDLAVADHLDRPFPEVDCVVFCAAMARFSDCRQHPELAFQVNVAAPSMLAEKFVDKGAQVILLSTSAVFDSLVAGRMACDPQSPVTEYGRLKAMAEKKFLQFSDLGTIFRLTKVVDRDDVLFNEWKSSLMEGKPIKAFSDHFFSPLPLIDIVEELAAIIRAGTPGIVQISGTKDISYHTAAIWLAERLKVPTSLVVPVSAGDNGIPVNEILKHTTMNVSRLVAITGYSPPSAEKVLAELTL